MPNPRREGAQMVRTFLRGRWLGKEDARFHSPLPLSQEISPLSGRFTSSKCRIRQPICNRHVSAYLEEQLARLAKSGSQSTMSWEMLRRSPRKKSADHPSADQFALDSTADPSYKSGLAL